MSAADRGVPGVEVRKIASELGFEHADFINARSAYREYLAVRRKPASR